MTLSTDERRALGLIAGLLLVAAGGRWLERPQRLLEDVPAIDVAAVEEASRAARPDPATSPSRDPAAPIDPNTATAAELDRLPGIGPSMAQRIVEERARGPFTHLEDLTRVRGIGAALAKKLAGRVSLPAGPARSNSPAAAGLTPVAAAPAGASGRASGEPLDINQIGSIDLQKVPGVGPVMAARLIARRDSVRRFTSWDQVDEVAGVGPALLSRLNTSLVLRP